MKNLYLFIFIGLFSCATFKPYEKGGGSTQKAPPASDIEHSVFAISDLIESEASPMISVLQDQLSETKGKNTLLVLGNFGLRSGFPDSSHAEKRRAYDNSLAPTLELINSNEGTTYLLPGLNEWSKGRLRGFSRVNDLQDHVSELVDDEEVLLPGDGCPGPVEKILKDGTVLLLIDTQWWFQNGINEEESTCDIKSKGDFIVALNDAVKRHYNKKVIVAGFHPLYTNGPAGGYYPLGKHFSPPIVGTLHAWYKRIIGDAQDASNFSYRIFRTILRRSFRNHPNLIYLSAKEKSLQYFMRDSVHLVVSGSMSGATAVAHKEGPEFAYGRKGFTRIDHYRNGEVWLRFLGVEDGREMNLIYEKKLYRWVEPPKQEVLEALDFSGETRSAFATKKHEKSKNKRGLTGLNYRVEWSAEIPDVPVFDIGKEKGGLKIVKKGGGMQTRSLRLQDSTGRQWVLRSIEKYPANALPVELRGTFAEDLITDQVSASHPYGALVIPKMASAVGVYHTNPRLVYLPDDPRLGIYQKDFANGLYLFEERPANEVWQNAEFFGKPDDIINTLKLIRKMTDDGDHHPDQVQTVRSRLFDVVIGDWDRHDDQWRWAKYNKAEKYDEKIDLYRPIPRDRDQAFFFGDGAILGLGSRKWGQPKFQGFKHKIRDVEGLAFNARYFDRFFMTEADWSVWQSQARHIQENLTDEVIESSVKDWPKKIYDLNGEVIISKLKRRRDDLSLYARTLYEFFSEDVNVLGTEEADRFVVERIDNSQTRVTVFRVKKNKREIKGKYYERLFENDVTEEIRLYGFGGKDEFELSGDVTNGIKIRIIGGDGKDIILDQSKVGGLGKRTIVYDTKTGTQITRSSETKVRTSDRDEMINNYNRREFRYDVLAPKLFGGFNPDDFILIGGGFSITKQGFRAEPFKQRHTFLFDIATRSNSFNFKLVNEFNRALGKWDFISTVDVSEPSFADFFYGFGNGTEVDEDAREDDSQFYRARYSVIRAAPSLRRRWNDDKHSIEIGGFFERINVETEDNDTEGNNRFIFAYAASRQAQGFDLLDEDRNFGGGFINYAFDNTDSRAVPTRGFRYNLNSKLSSQIGDEDSLRYAQFSSNLSFYFTIGRSERVTLATRIGGIVTGGDFEFYHAARLGGLNNLRGYRRLRFAGQHAIYQNNDIRIKLFDLRSKVIVGPFGINLLADFGRVWANDLPGELGRTEWHKSIGGGLWLAPFKALVINLDYSKSLSRSDESGVPFVRFGFLF